MATNSRGRTELATQKRYQDGETSPERTMVWVEIKSNKEQKAPVVYYLSRNGQLEHPHFLEVPFSSPRGLFLKDVIHRVNSLRGGGGGMANRYSWSSKRSHKNGFVWQDLSENDFIYPFHGCEYVLKGSLLLATSLSFRSYEISTSTSSISKNNSETHRSGEDSNVTVKIRRKHYSWSEFKELDENKTYKVRSCRAFSSEGNSVSTQTDDNARQRRVGGKEAEEHEREVNQIQSIIELNRPQPSRPLSTSISKILRSLNISADIRDQTVENDRPSRRIKASV